MAEILTTTAQLRSQAEMLRGLNDNFKSNVSQLESIEGSLMGMWDGDAKTAFHQAFTKDKTQMDNFYNAIAQYAYILEQIADNYDSTEATNTSTATTRKY